MSKYELYIIFLLVLFINVESQPTKEVNNLPAPKSFRIIMHKNYTEFSWNPIPNDEIDKYHPVLGYKLKIWPNEKIKLFSFITVDGEKKLFEEYDNLRKPSYLEPETEPTVMIVRPMETTVTVTSGFEQNVRYVSRVQAFNDLGDGPYSIKLEFNLLPKASDITLKLANIHTSIP